MVQTDKQALLDMGFSDARVTKALQMTKNSGLQSAMDWLFAHADDNVSDSPEVNEASECAAATQASGSTDHDKDGEISQDQATAQSLKCEDCGKLLRDAAAAELHAVKTQHVNFSESVVAIKPLTEEEKSQKLKDLQARLAAKREEKQLLEVEERKKSEQVRRRTGQEIVALKEKKEQDDMKKALDDKKREKQEEKMARERVRAQLESDKRERHRKAEEKKRLAQGIALPAHVTAAPVASNPLSNVSYSEARLNIRTPDGKSYTQNFSADDTLSKVYNYLEEKIGPNSFKLWQPFPRKMLGNNDLGKSLKDLCLVPSAALIAQ